MNKLFYFILFVFLLVSIDCLAQQDPIPLVRFWGVIENVEGESPNCNLVNDARIFRGNEDLTYTMTLGFHNGNCYYSIDVELSNLNSGDALFLKVDEILSETEVVYGGSQIINFDVVVELPDGYYSFIEGCMDKSALNYDGSANINVGCEYSIVEDIIEELDDSQEDEDLPEEKEDDENEQDEKPLEVVDETTDENENIPVDSQTTAQSSESTTIRREPNLRPREPSIPTSHSASDSSSSDNVISEENTGYEASKEKQAIYDPTSNLIVDIEAENGYYRSQIYLDELLSRPLVVLVVLNVFILGIVTLVIVSKSKK